MRNAVWLLLGLLAGLSVCPRFEGSIARDSEVAGGAQAADVPAGAPAGVPAGFFTGVPLYLADGRLESGEAGRLAALLPEDGIVFLRANPAQVRLLPEVLRVSRPIRVCPIRQSVADLARDAEILAGQRIRFDYLCYNPEAFPSSHTPPEEIEDPVTAVQRARELARRYRARLIVVPDTRTTLVRHGAEMARHADVFAIQLQRWQLLPDEEFRREAEAAIAIVRRGNPGIPIVAQLSTNPPVPGGGGKAGKVCRAQTPEEMIRRIRMLRGRVDGVGFLAFRQEDGVARLEAVLRGMR